MSVSSMVCASESHNSFIETLDTEKERHSIAKSLCPYIEKQKMGNVKSFKICTFDRIVGKLKVFCV